MLIKAVQSFVIHIFVYSLTQPTYQPIYSGAWRATCSRGGAEGNTSAMLCQSQNKAIISISNNHICIFFYIFTRQHEKFTSQLQLMQKLEHSREATKSPEFKGAEGGKETKPSEQSLNAEEKLPSE